MKSQCCSAFLVILLYSLLILSSCKHNFPDQIALDKKQGVTVLLLDHSVAVSLGVLETGEAGLIVYRRNQEMFGAFISTNSMKYHTVNYEGLCPTYTYDDNCDGVPEYRMTVKAGKIEKLEIFMNGEFVPAEQKDCKWWIGEKITKYEDGRWLLVPPEDVESEQSEEIPEAKF